MPSKSNFLNRKKKIEKIEMEHSKLSRVLNVFDLTTLGIGSTLGGVIYIIVASIILKHSGPSIIISFVIAFFASLLSALAYAELGARVPRSGSAYLYIYVTIGEFIAFIIGWDVILEFTIGCASIASSYSKYIDSLANHQIKNALISVMPMHVSFFGPFPDFLAFGVTLAITVLIVIGVKESIIFNKFCTVINIAILLFIIICGFVKSNISNWQIDKSNFNPNNSLNNPLFCNKSFQTCGEGGFFPFGFRGVIEGASKCMFAYIGFDAISTTGDEVKNPSKAIPISIIATLVIVSILYVGISAALTLMMPYYLLDSNLPITSAFLYVNLSWAQYIALIGTIVSILASLYAGMFPLARIAYSMALDGMLFKPLSYVLPKVKTPAISAITTGLLTGILATLFNLDQLIEMTSIGTIMAYTMVSICVLILRYRPDHVDVVSDEHINFNDGLLKRLFNPSSLKCNKLTSRIVNVILSIAVLDLLVICLIVKFSPDVSKAYLLVIIVLLVIIAIILMIIIWRQPQNQNIKTFKTPIIPLITFLNVAINIYLMLALSSATWIRFGIWLALGVCIYFLYSIRHSVEKKKDLTIEMTKL